ncbi:MAG: DUF2905 domain-containing protein [Thermodesulfovibrionales bacterium]
MLEQLGKSLIYIGVALAVLGGLLYLGGRVPYLGKLPGDILIQRKNFTFYFPLATGLIISLVISLVLWLLGRGR